MIGNLSQGDAGPSADCAGDRPTRPGQIARRGRLATGTRGLLLALVLGPIARAQIPPPEIGPSRSPDLIARRLTILQAERDRLGPLAGGNRPATIPEAAADGSTRFIPLAEVVAPAEAEPDPAETPAAALVRLEAAARLFDLARDAARRPTPPLAFIDACLRATLARQPGHAEARRLLGFVPHAGKGWATPFAVQELARGKVKDPTFGWVAADWVPHLNRGELPAPRGSQRWLPATEADALRRDWPSGWVIDTEHFEIHANVPLSGAIAFGRQLESFHQLFFALMADLIGPEKLPLALRLRTPGLAPTVSNRKHRVFYFATRGDYNRYLAPIRGGTEVSLGIYLPRKKFGKYGNVSYFFNDVGGQLDVSATLYHEVSHQLLFESAGPDDYERNKGNYWVFEGLGTYFETLEVSTDGSIRVGGLVGPRLAVARQRIVAERDFVPLEDFVNMDHDAFWRNTNGEVYHKYAEAMALAVFLMQARDGAYREAFLDYARDAYRGMFRGGGGRSLVHPDRLGKAYPELQREFLSYLARYPTATSPASPPPGHAKP